MKKLLSVVLASMMLLALFVAAAPAFDEKAKADPINLLDVSTKDLNGNAFSGEVFGQYDITILNVWATWCGPCKGEMPYFQQIHIELETRGVNIVGLLFDDDSVSDALAIQQENGLTYKTILAGTNDGLKTLKSVMSIPVTYYVNREGYVCENYTHVGSQSYENWIKSIVAVMYWEYGIEMTDLAPLPDPTIAPTPSPSPKPVDDSSFTFDEVTRTLTVSGTATGNYGCDNSSTAKLAPWHDLTNVKHVIISEGMKYIGTYAFQRVDGIETLSLPSTLRYIAMDAFYFTQITDIVIPEGVVTMESQSFYSVTLSLPSTLVNIPYSYFLTHQCVALASITVAENNPVLCSVDGVLYSKDKKKLLFYPMYKAGTEYTVLPETEIIGSFAVSRSARLKTLHMSKNVHTLMAHAIYSMSLLKAVYFYGNCPATIDEIRSIDSCPRLVNIYYAEGTTGWESTFCGIATSSFKPVTTLLGDVNGDASVTQTDALLLLRTLAGWTTTIDTTAADINGDTQVTQADALLLLRHLAGWTVAQFA